MKPSAAPELWCDKIIVVASAAIANAPATPVQSAQRASDRSTSTRGERASRRAPRILSRISAAALRVNVIASTASGASTVASNARQRWIRSSVFPEPAGA